MHGQLYSSTIYKSSHIHRWIYKQVKILVSVQVESKWHTHDMMYMHDTSRVITRQAKCYDSV